MLGEIVYEACVHQDLRSIGDSCVAAQIYDICDREIQVLASTSQFEGWIRGRHGDMWRRAIRRSEQALFEGYDIDEVDDFARQACDHVIIYRLMTAEDKIRLQHSGDAILVLGVIHNRDLMPLILGQLPDLPFSPV